MLRKLITSQKNGIQGQSSSPFVKSLCLDEFASSSMKQGGLENDRKEAFVTVKLISSLTVICASFQCLVHFDVTMKPISLLFSRDLSTPLWLMCLSI